MESREATAAAAGKIAKILWESWVRFYVSIPLTFTTSKRFVTITFTFTEPVKEKGADISVADVNLGTRNCDRPQSPGGLDSEVGQERQSLGQKQQQAQEE